MHTCTQGIRGHRMLSRENWRDLVYRQKRPIIEAKETNCVVQGEMERGLKSTHALVRAQETTKRERRNQAEALALHRHTLNLTT